MTPEQHLKTAVLHRFSLWCADIDVSDLNAANIDERYDLWAEADDSVRDAKNEVRSGEVETGIKCDWSRHYESKSVAAKMPDGTWVGWTCWYGGGKHGRPEEIDWMNEAYFLRCTEEQKLVTVRTFERVEPVEG